MKSFTLEKSVPVKLLFVNHISNLIEVNDYDIKFMMITEAESNDQEHMTQAYYDQNVSFSKVVNFLSKVINNSLVFDRECADHVIQNFADYDNNMIMLPDISDRTLTAALHCKFNSIISKNTIVEKVTVLDKLEDITYEYLLIDDDYSELPTEETWCGDLSYWDECWWHRNDTGTIDNRAQNQEEYDNWLELKQEQNIDQLNTSLFTEVEEYYKELFHTNKHKEGEVIEVDFESKTTTTPWKPTLVE